MPNWDETSADLVAICEETPQHADRVQRLWNAMTGRDAALGTAVNHAHHARVTAALTAAQTSKPSGDGGDDGTKQLAPARAKPAEEDVARQPARDARAVENAGARKE